jgi:hypothetical protein
MIVEIYTKKGRIIPLRNGQPVPAESIVRDSSGTFAPVKIESILKITRGTWDSLSQSRDCEKIELKEL